MCDKPVQLEFDLKPRPQLKVEADISSPCERLKATVVKLLEENVIQEFLLYPEDVQDIAEFAAGCLEKNKDGR